ncbi:hypothetical protein Taro_041830 [Colocasia esculenta]|uniref:Uncharacterized protein n=1 Tax=Colocasia esculenta TaxID=4460 RepID=A0A843WCG2_COLES|nr:hypothetical protein [Colocasia esculenta]
MDSHHLFFRPDPLSSRRPDRWTSISDILSTSCASMSERSCDLERCRNIVNVTVELSSFGQPKKEKLEPHLCPLREATTTTWSKYFLGHSLVSEPVLWHLGDVLEREWLSRRLVRRLETPRHLSRRSLCHRTHTLALFHHLLLRKLRD